MLNQNQSNNQTFISLNYPELRVDNLQITKDDLGKNAGQNKSIQANFIGKPNEPNVIYSKTDIPQKYQAKQLYILGKLHKDLDIDYDGELIIKNQSQTTQQTVYTIFLLKTNTLVHTLVQSLVKSITNPSNQLNDPETLTSLAINDMIDLTKPTKYIVYSSANTTIIINTNVINVGFDLKDYSTNSPITDLLISTKMSTSIVEMNNQDQSIKKSVNKSVNKSYEGFSLDKDGQLTNDEKDGDYMVCDNLPVGSEEELSYLIPGNSAVVDSITANSAFNSIMYIILIFIFYLIVYFISPIIYKWPYYLYNTADNSNINSNLGWLGQLLAAKYSHSFLNPTDDAASEIQKTFIFTTREGLVYTSSFITTIITLLRIGIVNKQNAVTASGILLGIAYIIGVLATKNDKGVQEYIKNNKNITTYVV